MTVARHTAFNLGGSLVPVAVSLVVIPLYLSIIGLERYGILAICWLLLGYFNLFDFGLGRATAQKIASLPEQSDEEASRVFWTAALLSCGLAVIATILFIPAARYGLGLIKIESAQVRAEVGGALPYLVASLPLGVANSVARGALQGRRRFLEMNLIHSAGTIGISVLPLAVAALYGPKLATLLAASLVARLASVALLAWVCRKAVPVRTPAWPRWALVSSMLRYGGWTTGSEAVAPLLSFWDRYAIGAMIGSAAVALYVVPFSLVSQLVVIPAALASALFPRLAGESGDEAKLLTEDGVRVLVFILTPLTMGMLIAAGPFLYLWLGPEPASASSGVAYILLIGFWANSFAWLPAAKLQASGRPSVVAKIHLSELIPYALLLYICLKTLGLNGAALAWTLRATGDALAQFIVSGTSRKVLRRLALDACFLLTALGACLALPLSSPLRWAILAAALVVSLAVSWWTRPDVISRQLDSFRMRWALPGAGRKTESDG